MRNDRDERSKKIEALERMASIYRCEFPKEAYVTMLRSVREYSADEVERAAETVLKNSDRFSIKNLCEAADELDRAEAEADGEMTTEEFDRWYQEIDK